MPTDSKPSLGGNVRDLIREIGELISLRMELLKLNSSRFVWVVAASLGIVMVMGICAIAMAIELSRMISSYLLLLAVENDAQAHLFAFLILLSFLVMLSAAVLAFLSRWTRRLRG